MRRIRFTTTGWMKAPAFVLGLPRRDSIAIPAVVAICERLDGSILLIDAGWSAETCANPRSLGLFHQQTLGVQTRPGDDVASQMRGAGLDPARVTTIVATHLHLDHVGGASDCPNAELIATHDEVAEAYRAAWMRGYRKSDLERVKRLRLVRPGPAPELGFSNAFSLEESVTLLDAHGHTAGHTAVMVRVGETTWVHGGDAAYLRRELFAPSLCPFSRMMAHDPRAARIAQRRLRDCSKLANVRVVLSHDAADYELLPRLRD